LISILRRLTHTAIPHLVRVARRPSLEQEPCRRTSIKRINRYAASGETIIVPGKVLGSGAIDQPVVVAALNFSKSAEEKIAGAKGSCITIEQLVTDNPKGSGVRILR